MRAVVAAFSREIPRNDLFSPSARGCFDTRARFDYARSIGKSFFAAYRPPSPYEPHRPPRPTDREPQYGTIPPIRAPLGIERRIDGAPARRGLPSPRRPWLFGHDAKRGVLAPLTRGNAQTLRRPFPFIAPSPRWHAHVRRGQPSRHRRRDKSASGPTASGGITTRSAATGWRRTSAGISNCFIAGFPARKQRLERQERGLSEESDEPRFTAMVCPVTIPAWDRSARAGRAARGLRRA